MRYTVQLRDRGTLTLPQALRRRYHYGAGDVFSLMDLDGVFVLAPQASLVAKLAGEIEIVRERAGLPLDALLQAAREDRHGRPG